ncbi:MAG: GntR family transcriptional regulator [Propionibacteriaceae bacterium]
MQPGLVKHAAIRDLLSVRIARMEPGDQLPTETQLCHEYAVSRITIRRAMGDLEAAGLLIRQQGKGTFVSRPALPQVFRENLSGKVVGFHQQQAALGNRVATTVISNEVVFDIRAAEKLGISPSSPIVRLERLRYVNNQLHQHAVTWLDAVKFPTIADHDFTNASLFGYLHRAHDVELSRNELMISIVNVRGEVANFLNVREGTPLLGMTSAVYGDDETVVTYGVTTHAADFGEIAISLQAQEI